MTTEKEKRFIDFVRLYLVDFINAESENEQCSLFDRKVIYGIRFLTTNITDYYLDMLNPESTNTIGHIHSILLKMLRIALIDGEFKKLYPEANNRSLVETELEKYISELFRKEENKDCFKWRGKGETYILPNFFTQQDVYSECEYLIIRALYTLFESQYGDNAIGYQYFSFCPKCGKFFYKKRKDQVYCSERCRSTDGTRRFRKKQT